MVSSGLSGLAAVMVEMTVPGQRRMALTPSSCPITDQSEAKKTKSVSTLSSGEIQRESPSQDTKKRKKIQGFFDGRKTWTKSMTENPIVETNNSNHNNYRLNSSPNLSMFEDRRASDTMRNRLAPRDALISVEADGSIDGANLFSNYDKTCNSSDPESVTSDDRALPKGTKSNKSKRKKRDKSNNNLSLSERNISARERNGSISSPFLKRLVGFGRSRSNKGLNRTDSSDSDKLIQLTNAATPNAVLPRHDSSINILITAVDSENEISDNQGSSRKMLSNGRKKTEGRQTRSASLLQNPSQDGFA